MYSNFEHDVLKLQFRASVRTFNPKQLKYEDKSDIKFKHSVFMRNVNRVKAATADMAEPEVIIRELQAILNWESPPKTMGAFIGFEGREVLLCYNIWLRHGIQTLYLSAWMYREELDKNTRSRFHKSRTTCQIWDGRKPGPAFSPFLYS